MNNPASPILSWTKIILAYRCDRWSIKRRLQELNIPCACPADGTLRVNANHAIDLLLIQSAVRQCVAPRHETVNWLERCYRTQVSCSVNH
ncbi:MAG: Asr1405/Asl0597 family protein [Cyanobacteria bacterium P01_H01_bin.15]